MLSNLSWSLHGLKRHTLYINSFYGVHTYRDINVYLSDTLRKKEAETERDGERERENGFPNY